MDTIKDVSYVPVLSFDTGPTPGTQESHSLTHPWHSWAAEREKKINKGFMSWDKDQEKWLQGQNRLNLSCKVSLLLTEIRGG